MLSNTKEANDYRKEFGQYYLKNILPLLAQFETQRKTKKLQQLAIVIISFTILFAGFFYLIFCGITEVDLNVGHNNLIVPVCGVFIFLGAGGTLWASYLGKLFEKEVKKVVMIPFLKFFGEFKWASSDISLETELRKSILFGNFNNCTSSDYFEGVYRDCKMKFSYCGVKGTSGNAKSPVFGGIFVKLDFYKNVNLPILITSSYLMKGVTSETRLDSNMQKVELEDTEFNELFDVYSQDQAEARYILNPSLMEHFKHLKAVFKSESINASFVGSNLFLALVCKKAPFVLADLRKPVTDTEQIQELFEEFVAVLSLVDLLHLDSKTGL